MGSAGVWKNSGVETREKGLVACLVLGLAACMGAGGAAGGAGGHAPGSHGLCALHVVHKGLVDRPYLVGEGIFLQGARHGEKAPCVLALAVRAAGKVVVVVKEQLFKVLAAVFALEIEKGHGYSLVVALQVVGGFPHGPGWLVLAAMPGFGKTGHP